MASAFTHVKEGVSVLMDAFKQFANKPIQDCIKDGFPDVFLRCQNPQATESSINDDVSKSEPGRNYMQATDKLGPVSFPSSYGEYKAVRIAVILNYAPDDELDKKGNPTLHFQRDAAGKFYNATIRNLFDTMQTLMCLAGFDPYVAMLILLSSVIVMNTCMLMGSTKGWSKTEEYHYLSQFQLPFAKNIIEYVLGKCENLVGVMVFGHKASENILPWLRDNYNKKLLIQRSNVFLSHPQNIRWTYTLKHAQHYTKMFSKIMVSLGVVIPSFVDGMQLLRCFLTKKYTLEMMEEFVDSEVLEAVRQRFAMVKIERTAKVEELKKEQEEHARQRKKEQEEHSRQRKEEQEKQAPKTRGKNKTFDDRMEDLKRYKEMHGHANVTIPEDKSLASFCNSVRYGRTNPGKGVKLTDERIAAFNAMDFNWTSQEYVTRSFDERIGDLEKYKQTHGHLRLKRLEDSSLYQFCMGVRHSLKHVEKDGTRKLTVERIKKLDDIGFTWIGR